MNQTVKIWVVMFLGVSLGYIEGMTKPSLGDYIWMVSMLAIGYFVLPYILNKLTK